MERKVKRVPPDLSVTPLLLNVAAYARVSGGKQEQLESLSAQVSHYSAQIQNHPGWAYVGVFVDEAMTGTKGTRPGFQQMMAACREGKIDLLLVKSLSRFARNTVTLLEYVRELRELGVDVFFEREGIHTNSGDGELLLTILAAYAQEESLSVSENTKWRIRKQFEQGKSINNRMLGYRTVDGRLELIPDEAETVRMIFDAYLSGLGTTAIARMLTAKGRKTLTGGPWWNATISKMLENTAYMGDLWLQKKFTVDHLGKKQRFNTGELPKYLVQGNYEPIIDRETFEAVQRERIERAGKHHPAKDTPPRYMFSGVITCGHCGGYYRRKTANSGTPYAKPVWICDTYNFKGKAECPLSKQIPEYALMASCAEALGASSFDEAEFRQRVTGITALDGNKLVFKMADGTQIERIWQPKPRSGAWDEERHQRAHEHKLSRRNANEPGSDQ